MAAGSPELTVRDFLLWGYLKERTAQESLTQMQELMHDIRSETVNMNQELMRRFLGGFVDRTKIMSRKRSRPFSRYQL
jgi:hypothetical protein